MLFDSWSYLSVSYSATELGFGLGLLSLGLSLLAILAAGAVFRMAGCSIVHLAKNSK